MKFPRILFLPILAAALGYSPSSWAIDLEWHGFGSIYDGQALSKNLAPYPFLDSTNVPNNHANFTTFSLLGLNLSATVNDDLMVAAQFLALGNPVGASDSFALIAEWAFVNYTPSRGLSIKGGRQLLPIFLASDYIHVGFLLPYRQVPFQIFELAPFTRFDGVSVNQAIDVKGMTLTAGVFGGKPSLDLNSSILTALGVTAQTEDLLGAQLVLDGEGWRVRASAFRDFTSLTSLAGTFNAHEQFFTAAYRFDRFGIVSWGEYLAAFAPDGTPVSDGGRDLATSHGFYLLGGYHLGRFLPRYTFAQASEGNNITTITQGAPHVLNGKTTSHILGLNYQAGANAVLKVEYEFDLVPSPQGGGYFVGQPLNATDTSGQSFYAGVDFIF